MNEKILQGVLIAIIILGSGYLVYSFVVPTPLTTELEVTETVTSSDDSKPEDATQEDNQFTPQPYTILTTSEFRYDEQPHPFLYPGIEFGDPDYYDARIVRVNLDTGEEIVLVPSIKDAIPALRESPFRTLAHLSSPGGASKIYFDEIISESDALPFAVYEFDLKTNEFVRLSISEYYDGSWYGDEPSISPDGTKLASLSGPDYTVESYKKVQTLYLLDLVSDTPKLLVELKDNETFERPSEGSIGIIANIKWLNNTTIEYSVYNLEEVVEVAPEPVYSSAGNLQGYTSRYFNHAFIENRQVQISQ